ncbi:hypothetical protein B0H13DRAFT_2303223 [Mycena leptocephala]|nr:hypothetical protein B0H13DRAFT_2303223 [Mycena leptocephala]
MVQTATETISPSNTSRVVEHDFHYSEQPEQTDRSVLTDSDASSVAGTSSQHPKELGNESTSINSDWLEQTTSSPVPQEFKIMITGEVASGKTCLIDRFVLDQYAEDVNPTIIEYYRKRMIIDGQPSWVRPATSPATPAHLLPLDFIDTGMSGHYLSTMDIQVAPILRHV